MKLIIEPLDESLVQLYREHRSAFSTDSGINLFLPSDIEIPFNATELIGLRIKAKMIDDSGRAVSWMLMPRSSIYKTKVRLANSVGLIDAGYRGEIMIALDNIDKSGYIARVTATDRLTREPAGVSIVQAVAPNLVPITCELGKVDDDTERGNGGFGSTGNVIIDVE